MDMTTCGAGAEMKTIVGIDLGTTGSRVAALIDGKLTILENPDGEGTTPSHVAMITQDRAAVGDAARKHAERQPGSVAYAVKRLIGRTYDDPEIERLKQVLPYRIVPSPSGAAWVELDGVSYSPLEICRIIFADLLATVVRHLGAHPHEAVVAVPAYYGHHQRMSVKAAAEAAGFSVPRIISEPTAAALLRDAPDRTTRTIAIYDLGGGTFDISILRIGDGIYEVISTDGDPLLGGEDFDQRLLAHIIDRVGLDQADLDRAARQRLLVAAERAKMELSARDSARIVVSALTGVGDAKIDVDLTVTRETLQELTQDLVDRTLAICARAMQTGERRYHDVYRSITSDEIDEVILVGGSTRLPFVEECVERFFGRKAAAGMRREDAVALGCALQAAVLDGRQKDILLLDVLPFTLSVSMGGDRTPVLFKNTTIPYKNTVELQGVASAGLQIWEEDGSTVARQIGVVDLGEAATAASVLKVTLDVDANSQLLAHVKGAGRRPVSQYIGADRSLQDQFWGGVAAMRPESESSQPAANMAQHVSDRLRILAIGTEWRSGKGGLSTLNRELCKALAADGHSVCCMVVRADAQDAASAAEAGVILIEAVQTPGQSEAVSLCRKPRLPSGWLPDVVIGHGRVTGPAAVAQVDDHFPRAKRVHFIHMAPDEIEWFKPDRTDDAGKRAEARTRIEIDLGRAAANIVAIGPRLHNRFLTDFHSLGVRAPLRLDPGFDVSDVQPLPPPPGRPWRILVVARAEDEGLKGLDIAARAVALVTARRSQSEPPLELVVKGAEAGTSDQLRTALLGYAAGPLKVSVKPYDSVEERLDAEYRRASLVLMPSRTEGFGLVGLEAIIAGVPVLLSSESGLGELIGEEVSGEQARRLIVPTSGDLDLDGETWARSIQAVLHDRNASFQNAASLRSALAERKPWSSAVSGILKF